MRTQLFSLLFLGAAAPLMAQAHAPEVKWGPAPTVFAPGARLAVLHGDPSGTGEFTVRLELPGGYFIAPHSHPGNEHVTVISGLLRVGMGDAEDIAKTMVFKPGEFGSIPGEMPHYARALEKTVVQIHGVGPLGLTYVHPKDDPRTAGQ